MTSARRQFVISNAKMLNKNTLRASFDLEMPSGLVIRGAMLFEKSTRRWVGFPSKERVAADGTRTFFPLLEFVSREVADRFSAAVLPLAERALDLPPLAGGDA